MSKHPNPVRGYVPCPVCSSVATVHQVGEGRLIAEGEPPKNSRNLGLKYYKCPSCGNSSMSKSVDKYIDEHFSTDKDAVAQALEALDSTEANALDTVESVEPDVIAEASNSKVESTELTEPPTDESQVENKPVLNLKRVLTALGVLMMILWVVRLLMPKPQSEEVANAATE
ncbi:hypothetical protein OH458_20720 [Vibrio sp. MarTm2]|uniref:hypothetical protein n=1 Tax=Vibrio sp. MarTm2 TaxID=2998831 RepID=UPI0022CD900D|nr:hypothetical protein [Vibrio sp. MarTm2]MDA0130490.1 hypothetical protein [Vibrio sp. MarTm2]